MEELEPFRLLNGLTYVAEKGKINTRKTVAQLGLRRFIRDIRSLDLSYYDLVICDYEPVTAYAARRSGVTSIGAGHQYAFWYGQVPYPKGKGLSKRIMRAFAPVDVPIGFHWHHFGGMILPPIIPPLDSVDNSADKVLVYLPWYPVDIITRTLQRCRTYEFIIYHDMDAPWDEDHLHGRPLSKEGFRHDLGMASYYLTNAGFDSISEALHLGKAIMALPLRGQPEQLANAMALAQLGLAETADKLTPELVQDWLNQARPTTVQYPDYMDELMAWIESGKWHNPRNLTENVWSRVEVLI